MMQKQWVIVILLCVFSTTGLANLEMQREQYREAISAADAKKWKTFEKLSDELSDYPLHPYLEYYGLKKRIQKVSKSEVDTFIEQQSHSHLSTYLRGVWLHQLAKKRYWREFLNYYDDRSNSTLKCHATYAKIKTKQNPIDEAKALWLVGKSQPDACDPVFAWMKKSGLMTQSLIWQRTELALKRSNTQLAKYLSRSLKGRELSKYKKWKAIRRRPESITHQNYQADNALNRQLGIQASKIALNDSVERSLRLWRKVQRQYVYPLEEKNKMSRLIAVRSAQRHEERAQELLSSLPKDALDQTAQEWSVRAALRDQNWNGAMEAISALPKAVQLEPQWQYWLARAYEKTGKAGLSQVYYQSVAKERSYYGFMAAERLGAPYQFNQESLGATAKQVSDVSSLPIVKRMRELYHHDEINYARVEWNAVQKQLSKAGLKAAAKVMQEWGWHEMAIRAVSSAKHLDDIALRFPQPYKQHREKHAEAADIDPDWAYAIMRRESAMAEDAVSSANAKGLMQLLPSTAKSVARKNQWKWRGSKVLLQPETNIKFGTAYLGELYDQWNRDDIVLATASYNAGPHRVKKWLPEQGTMPLDIWIDTIPFEETRQYVRIISEYKSVIDWVNRGRPADYGNQLHYAAKSVSGEMVAKRD